MEYVALIPVIGPLLATVIPFIVMIAIVIFIHELGHYLVGRWCGIHAETFSLGFGKELWHRIDKRGTRWRIAAVPVGGYVKFLGDADASSRSDFDAVEQMSPEDAARSFPAAAVWKRMLTVAAGPVANFILSIVVFTGLALWTGVKVPGAFVGEVVELEGVDFVLRPGDKVLAVEGERIVDLSDINDFAADLEVARPIMVTVERDGQVSDMEIPYPQPPLVSHVQPLSAASRAGMKKGDLILRIDGEPIVSFNDLKRVVMASEHERLNVTVLREGREIDLTMTPKMEPVPTRDGGFKQEVVIGVTSVGYFNFESVTPSLWEAIGLGVEDIGRVLNNSINAISHIINGDIDPSAIQGPLGIAQVSGEVAKTGLMDFIYLIGVISTAIGMLNLFPVPVLDGGHLVIFGYEAVAGRQPPEKVLNIAMSIGLGMVLLLMVFATYNDVMRWFMVG